MESESSLRERLIDVGVELVLAEGSASLGLREIARRAGVSHGAPRRHFPTHHALLSAIARRGFEDLAARVGAAIADTTSPRAQLQAVARVYVGYALERRGMFELMFRHDLLDSEQHASGERRLRESTIPLFERIVALVARCGEDQDDTTRRRSSGPDATPPPAVTAAALWSNLHGVAQLWAWGSLQLALDATQPAGTLRGDPLDRIVAAVLDAHLGPVNS
ncbi:TetR/AcrR family transcriptional regulator [Streptomyces sp. LX-29]|uniref:TetR/AcrR family transcriptional regulator n=1 Tax=Streptomyces sp. LX-29 TaxID=2900152 RepID=UPI00240E7F22|nr:TetR/AcrR family transcriptional regulator [Streptomyces sp. LX-29]WFB05752.1 TetR/AcrR family transcriptional regulator [Streptomyces sp. LX-29]